MYYPITTMPVGFKFNFFEQTLDILLKRKMELAQANLFPTESTEVRLEDFREMFDDMGFAAS